MSQQGTQRYDIYRASRYVFIAWNHKERTGVVAYKIFITFLMSLLQKVSPHLTDRYPEVTIQIQRRDK